MKRAELRSLINDLKICEYNSDERRDFIERYNFREAVRRKGYGLPCAALVFSAAVGANILGRSLSYMMGLPSNSLLLPDSHLGSFGTGFVFGSTFLYFTNPITEKWNVMNVARNLRYRMRHSTDMPGLEGKDLDSL